MLLNIQQHLSKFHQELNIFDNCCFETHCAQRIAATYPPGPEPIMTTSNELIVYFLVF
jgi:hypothetical protein